MNTITLKDALQLLLIETQGAAQHSVYVKGAHSIVAKHLVDIESADKESQRTTATSIRESTAKAFTTAANKLEASINKVQQEFNTDLIWQNTKYCKVVTLSKAMHEAGISTGDIFKVVRLDHDNKVWVRSDDNFACWFYICNLLPLTTSSEPVNLTSVDTIRGRKVARELKEFRENLKVGDRVKFKTGLGVEVAKVKAISGSTVVLYSYWDRTKDKLYPVDFKYAIK